MDSVQEPTPIPRRPLHEEAADRLRDLIVQGSLAPGARLNERLLTAQLGVSRTPLREAFKVLATEGLVELLPNRGAVVSPIDTVRLAETLAVMGALEALAGELACRHASDAQLAEIRALHYEMLACHARGDLAGYFKFNQAIHLRIVKYSGNAVLYHAYRQLNANVRRARYMANLSKERWDAAMREHGEILDALAAREVERLKVLLSDHLAHKLASVLGGLRAAGAEGREAKAA
jgi:DNA-binding GntR family transcriptional regulator